MIEHPHKTMSDDAPVSSDGLDAVGVPDDHAPGEEGRAGVSFPDPSEGQRWELESKEWTLKEHSADAMLGAVIYAVAGAVLLLAPFGGLSNIIWRKDILFSLYLACIVGVGIWAYVVARFKEGSVWETKTWIDFDDRSWNKYIRYTDASMPNEDTRLAFADLALICDDHIYGEGPDEVQYYSVALCRAWDVKNKRIARPPPQLSLLRRFRSEQESLDFAAAIAGRSGIACWKLDWSRLSATGTCVTRLF
ncbi:hypothetical protein CR152_25095 [Massilia violaceinigra]|uniref:Uncharacterized protein n=1 Tax=Massilia violaceinigra TaxID=2045208 RepID=A0A2D2DR11_9BURK|nr:hypothetical protein [Massilia violaceinigra]ATQ77410.1 hypothetical protein CR152_25095 [Massilia violaceinigra]